MHAPPTDVAGSREQEVEAIDAWQITLARRQLVLRAALGEIILSPAESVGGALMQVDARAMLLRDLDELAVADAQCEAAMIRACLTHYSRCLTARAAKVQTEHDYHLWLAERLHREAGR